MTTQIKIYDIYKNDCYYANYIYNLLKNLKIYANKILWLLEILLIWLSKLTCDLYMYFSGSFVAAIHNNFIQKFRKRIWNLRSYEKSRWEELKPLLGHQICLSPRTYLSQLYHLRPYTRHVTPIPIGWRTRWNMVCLGLITFRVLWVV